MEKFLDRLHVSRFIDGTIGGIHLWFLSGAIIAFIIFAIFFKLGVHPGVMIFISVPLFFLGNYLKLPVFSWIDQLVAIGGVFQALMFISLGMFVRALNIKYSKFYFPLGVISLMVFPFVKYYKVGPPIFMVLFFSTLMLIYFAKTKTQIGKASIIVKLTSKYNLYIYIFHLAFFRIANKILQIMYGSYYWQNWWYPAIFFTGIIGPIIIFYIFELPKSLFKKSVKEKRIEAA